MAANHTDLQSGCGWPCVFAVAGVVKLVRSYLAPDFPLFHELSTPPEAQFVQCPFAIKEAGGLGPVSGAVTGSVRGRILI